MGWDKPFSILPDSGPDLEETLAVTFETGNRAQQRSLATARRPEQTCDTAGRNAQVDIQREVALLGAESGLNSHA
jgi:hypothetical protein